MLYRTRCDEWVKLYEEGMSCDQIGPAYGVSKNAVYQALKRRGIQTRNTHESLIGRRQPHRSALKRKYEIPDERIFQRIDTEAKAYWLGFLMADGNVMVYVDGHRRHVLNLNLCETDRAHVEAFRDFLGVTNPLKETANPRSDKKLVRIQVACEAMVEDLIACGCVPRKTYGMSYPFDAVPWTLNRHFIRGYFDGDGTITRWHAGRKDAKVSFSCSTEVFAQGLRAIFLEVGIDCVNIWKVPKALTWTPEINQQAAIHEAYHWFYDNATIYLPRKRQKFEELLDIHPIPPTSDTHIPAVVPLGPYLQSTLAL